MHRLLIVDDDVHLLRALSITLRAYDHSILTCSSGAEALSCAAAHSFDLVLLDLCLPDMDGTTVIRTLRGWSDVPIIVLSGRHDQAIMADALDTGADDYVTKPFLMAELNARIRATLRRSQPRSASSRRVHRIGDWLIDIQAHVVTALLEGSGASAPHLTPKEWHLLEILLERPGTLVESGPLLAAVWGPGHEHSTNYLRTYFRQLRSKLEPAPSRPRHLITEPGLGHRYLP